jgi:hypothetical protein
LEVEGVELSVFFFNLSKVVSSSSLTLDKKIKTKLKQKPYEISYHGSLD